MTTRQQRRAAERATRKQAGKAVPPCGAAASNSTESTPISNARWEANRANAQLSTGARTPEGKAVSSKNAVKTALTGRTVLLPSDDADRYERHLAAYAKSFAPANERECELTQALADAAWRLDRIPGLEEAIYCKGSVEFADQVTETDPQASLTMLRMHTLLAYERQLRNLHIQEMRLHRLRKNLQAELEQLQARRQHGQKTALHSAALAYHFAKRQGKPFAPAEHGFEFSIVEIEAYLHRVNSAPQSQVGLPPSSTAKETQAQAA